MRSRVVAAAASALLLTAIGAAGPPVALADSGPYTLPFFNPVKINQDYGCTAFTAEPPFTIGKNADGTYYDCRSTPNFHKADDYRLTTGVPVVAAAAGRVVKHYNGSTGSTFPIRSEGNYLLIKYDATHYGLYYHLKQGTLLFRDGEYVSAGQQIAESDNSGNSTGAHLHYQLQNCLCSTANTPVAATYALDGKWTIGTRGRVPWLGAFAAQASGSDPHGRADVCRGQTTTVWVRFKNTGGQPWSSSNDARGNGRVVLRSTNGTGSALAPSPFKGTDWESATVVGPADQPSVAPDGIATFTFGLYAYGGAIEGTTSTVSFDLEATNLHAFDYSALGSYAITIFVVPHQTGECQGRRGG